MKRDLERRLDGEKLVCCPTYPDTFTFVPASRSPEWFWELPEWFWELEVEVLDLYLPSAILEKVAVESCERVPQTVELCERIGICDPLLKQLLLTFSSEVDQNTNNSLHLNSLQNLMAIHLLKLEKLLQGTDHRRRPATSVGHPIQILIPFV